METCSVCGYNIIPGDSFCTNCGVRHNRTPAQASPDAYAHTATAAAARSQLAVNGQVFVPAGGQVKVPTPGVDQVLFKVVPFLALASRMR